MSRASVILILLAATLIIVPAAVSHYCDCFPGGPASNWQNKYISVSSTTPVFVASPPSFTFDVQLHTTSNKGGGCLSRKGSTYNPTDCTESSGCYLDDSTCSGTTNPPIHNFVGKFISCEKQPDGQGSLVACSSDLSYSGQYTSTPESITLPGSPNDLWMRDVKVDVSQTADYGIYKLNFRTTWDPDIYAPTTSGNCGSQYNFVDRTGYPPDKSGQYPCGSFIKETWKEYEVTLCLYECTSDSDCQGSCDHFSSPCSAGGVCVGSCTPDCSGKECGDDGCSGSCGTCSNNHGTTTCSSGTCSPTCSSGWGDCDGNTQNGCETDLTTTSNCGSCGNTCVSSESCISGSCQSSCTPDCSGKECGDDGCSGSCGTCSNNHGTTTCSSGSCTPTCNSGWGNCDGNTQNGCETDMNSDNNNCGSCGNSCDSSESCISGVCTSGCTPDCSGKECGDDGCGGSCGTCSNNHGTTTCSSGTCSPTCSSGWGNCDSNTKNGCETSLSTTTNCGSCGNSCGSGESCVSGSCQSSCTPDCSGKECGDDGCGGTCGTCSNNHGTTTCSSGTCSPTCSSGWGNCDSNTKNGCETSLSTTTNCGSCGNSCGSGESCVSGSCQSSCTPDCSGKECGDDGCGGTCGECQDFEYCNSMGQCIVNCIDDCDTIGEATCADDVLGVCGNWNDDPCYEKNYTDCAATGKVCYDGACVTPACSHDSDCDDSVACTQDRCASPGEHNASCFYKTKTTCNAVSDGCCPAGCTNGDDPDCSRECTADSDCSGIELCCSSYCATPACSDDASCDDNNKCTVDECTSGSSCSASCQHTAITECSSISDGCCPSGCDYLQDPDCSVVCSDYSVSDCSSLAECEWCPLGQVCMPKNDVECTASSCSTDGEYCTDSCKWRDCFGANSACYCSGGECVSCGDGKVCRDFACVDQGTQTEESGSTCTTGRCRTESSTDETTTRARSDTTTSRTDTSAQAGRTRTSMTVNKTLENESTSPEEKTTSEASGGSNMLYYVAGIGILILGVVFLMFYRGSRGRGPSSGTSSAFGQQGNVPQGNVQQAVGPQAATIRLITSIRELRNKGYPDEQISAYLVSQGYDANMVAIYLRRI